MVGIADVVNMFYVVLLPVMWDYAMAIDCFKCFSFNKSDPDCGDPFHSAYGRYIKDCLQGQDGRVGLYPAKYCIKLIGNAANGNVEMVYRSCSLETLESQCGEFRFEGVQYNGCVMSCTENGCNRTSGLRVDWFNVLLLVIIVLLCISKLKSLNLCT
ncbi:hypothetical protein ACF0H5_014293 [Mactra antiquata]